jgi:hypothetical protein
MKNRRNYYRILHIQQDAPAAIIKASYRTQMQKLRMHPDLGGDEWNAAVLNEAYQVLSDPQRRKTYDAALKSGLDRQRSGSGAARQRTSGTRGAQNVRDRSCCAFCGTARSPSSLSCGPQDCPGCNGPTETVRILRNANGSDRSIERMTQHASLVVYTHPECHGLMARLRDLSPAGMQMMLDEPLAEGLLVRIHSVPVTAIARIRFCNRDSTGYHFIAGVEFLTVRFSTRSGTFLSTCA